MKRANTAAETCALNGWTVGTVVRGHEEWTDGKGVWTTWRITAIGEDCVMARTIRQDFRASERPPNTEVSHEHSVTFAYREWIEVTP